MAALASATRDRAADRRKARLMAVVVAPLAALVIWGLATMALGDLHQPSFDDRDPQPLTEAVVVLAALTAGLLGWLVIAMLERVRSHPRRLWLTIAALALLLSLAGPLSGHGVSLSDRLALVLMHSAVAAILIPLLSRTSSSARASDRP